MTTTTTANRSELLFGVEVRQCPGGTYEALVSGREPRTFDDPASLASYVNAALSGPLLDLGFSDEDPS